MGINCSFTCDLTALNMNQMFSVTYFTAGCQWRTSPKTLKTLIFAASDLIFWTVPLNASGQLHATMAAGNLGLLLVAALIVKVAHI